MLIVKAPSPVLSTTAKKVTKVDRAILSLIQEMEQTLNAASDPIGVGLAAPQIGKPEAIYCQTNCKITNFCFY